MSRKLNLVARLLARGRRFQHLGREHDALHILTRLAGFRELPSAVAEEVQVRMARIQWRRRRFVRARRHLTAALAHRPDDPRYHFRLASALNAGAKAEPERAAEHYRRSLELAPDQPRCLSGFGLLSLALGQVEEGLKCLRRAAELAPDSPLVVARLVRGLCRHGLAEEARTALRAALFRNPRDERFRRLYSDFQFRRLRAEQQAARRQAVPPSDDGPTLLPFVRPTTTEVGGRVIRRDPPASAAVPHLNQHKRRAGRKRAQ